jgi:hypothetical protein
MSQICPCEVALLEHIPVRNLVSIIANYVHKDGVAIIDELKYRNRGADNLMRQFRRAQLTDAEVKKLRMPDRRYSIGSILAGCPDAPNPLMIGNFSDRWIFAVAHGGNTYMRFLGETSGQTIVGTSSQCIMTVVDDSILVEIDNIQVDVTSEEFSVFGTPFMRSRRAELRAMMYNLSYLEPDDPQHALFDKVCDLAHKTIVSWLH